MYITTRRVPLWFPHGFGSVEGLLWGAEPRFELGPLTTSRRATPILSHAAP
jgi:hypothetical protein